MFGNPTGKPATGGPAGARLPGTAAGNPGPGVDSITGIEDDDSRKITAAEFRTQQEAARRFDTQGKKLALINIIPAITENTNTAELREIINRLSARVLSDYVVYNNPPLPKIKLNPPSKFDGTKKEDL